MINIICEEYNWDEGDCEAQPEGCTPGLVEDCNGICGPENWIGDGFCDDGSYSYNGNPIYFNCEEFNNDEGDCDGLGRTTQTRPYPNGRILIGELNARVYKRVNRWFNCNNLVWCYSNTS